MKLKKYACKITAAILSALLGVASSGVITVHANETVEATPEVTVSPSNADKTADNEVTNSTNAEENTGSTVDSGSSKTSKNNQSVDNDAHENFENETQGNESSDESGFKRFSVEDLKEIPENHIIFTLYGEGNASVTVGEQKYDYQGGVDVFVSDEIEVAEDGTFSVTTSPLNNSEEIEYFILTDRDGNEIVKDPESVKNNVQELNAKDAVLVSIGYKYGTDSSYLTTTSSPRKMMARMMMANALSVSNSDLDNVRRNATTDEKNPNWAGTWWTDNTDVFAQSFKITTIDGVLGSESIKNLILGQYAHCIDPGDMGVDANNPYGTKSLKYYYTITSDDSTGISLRIVSDRLRTKSGNIATGKHQGKVVPYQRMALEIKIEIPEKNINVSLKKSSSNPTITDNNSEYSLEGAVYGVYTGADCNEAGRIGTITTDASGNGSTGDMTVDNSVSILYIKELDAPKGYKVDSNIHSVAVNGTAVDTCNVDDEPETGKFKLTKQTNSGKPLSGAVFVLRGPDGRIYTPTASSTDANGEMVWENLPLGDYTATETSAPPGYSLLALPLHFTITVDGKEPSITVGENEIVTLNTGGYGFGYVFFPVAIAAAALAVLFKKKQQEGGF